MYLRQESSVSVHSLDVEKQFPKPAAEQVLGGMKLDESCAQI